MKIRSGFVSNSSSSSFICEISGRVESGMDISLSDCGMFECENGHTVDNEYRIAVPVNENRSRDALMEMLKKVQDGEQDGALTILKGLLNRSSWYGDDDLEDLEALVDENKFNGFESALGLLGKLIENSDGDDSDYEVDATECPICQMTHFRNDDLLGYLINKSGLTRAQIENNVRAEFSDYKSFSTTLKG